MTAAAVVSAIATPPFSAAQPASSRLQMAAMIGCDCAYIAGD